MNIDGFIPVKRAEMSMLDYTYDLLTELSDDELAAVQSVAIALIKKGLGNSIGSSSEEIRPFQPQTEEQLMTRIDHSLSQIGQGLYEDAEDVENELLMEVHYKFGQIVASK